MQADGRFGEYGGIYIPEILFDAIQGLERAFMESQNDFRFQREYDDLLARFAGRPTPLYQCRNLMSETKVQIYLKREDLLHGGAHKTNQVLGQALLAKRMGKTRLIAETGAGQHGVATAMAGALFGFETCIYMGKEDIERQRANVFRMELLGARVVPVEGGTGTLKDAIGEALRDWADSYDTTHYLLGTAAGPHPYPTMVREFQRIIGKEAKQQFVALTGQLPDAVIACVGGGSNAIGIFADFIDEPSVRLIGVEAAGKGLDGDFHAATLLKGCPGILHGAHTQILQDENGQIMDTYSVSAGLDYPGVGPEHAYLRDEGRAEYTAADDKEALAAFYALSQKEGIIPALESSHALAHAMKIAESSTKEMKLLVNLSGRGDKDLEHVRNLS